MGTVTFDWQAFSALYRYDSNGNLYRAGWYADSGGQYGAG